MEFRREINLPRDGKKKGKKMFGPLIGKMRNKETHFL